MWKKSETETFNQTSSPASQEEKSSGFHNPSPSNQKKSVIGSTISIHGNIMGEEDLLIEGSVEGKVELKQHSITVGEKGRIKADIYGRIITVEGNVEGNLFGTEQLIVSRTGIVRGNIVAPRVALEDGCNFKGNIDMRPKDSPVPLLDPEEPDI